MRAHDSCRLDPCREANPLQTVKKETLFGPREKINTLRATLLLRAAAILFVLVAWPVRGALPPWMTEWYWLISFPLLLYNSAFLIVHKKITSFLQKHPSALFMDLVMAIGILQIGGGWRSSYFVYTLTTIMLFTLFGGKRGAYLSSLILAAASIAKDPAGGLPSLRTLETFNTTNWDMRVGAALFYMAAGCILAYFSTLLDRLEGLSRTRIEETRKVVAMEEKVRLALDLHDSVKSKVTAVLLVFKCLLKRSKSGAQNIDDELQHLWRWLQYLQGELNHVMDSLKSEVDASASSCDLVALAEEQARMAEGMAGFSWRVLYPPGEMHVPLKDRGSLVRFFSEALMNACNHSRATSGTIELGCSGNSITVIVSDNGRGFSYSDREDAETTGLTSLKYRARELRGELVVETAPDKGCRLILTFPAAGPGRLSEN